jgi:putative modified peptide
MATQLPKAVASKLLDKLGSDDAFRALFQKDVVAALKQVGASDADANSCAGCLRVGKLADKATIKASSQALTSMLTAAMGQQPHLLAAKA